MTAKTIDAVPRVAQFIGGESYLTPFIGSLWAALRGMGIGREYWELLALSGAGNRLAWKPGSWEGSNVDILSIEDPPFAPHQRVIRAIGLSSRIRLCRPLAGLGGPFASEAQARAEIVASIDRGAPVIAMGILGPPECCVVSGYEGLGETLVGWNYFQGDRGFDPERPFRKEGWFDDLCGYLILESGSDAPSEEESSLEALRAIAKHARSFEVRGYREGFAAWEAMLGQLEGDDFASCSLALPRQVLDDDAAWRSTLQGRFYVYCDALCQIHERGVALPFYERLAARRPDWAAELGDAVAAWRECSKYGGFLWRYLTMDEAGFRKFADPGIRKILADEGRRSYAKDVEAIERVEALLRKA